MNDEGKIQAAFEAIVKDGSADTLFEECLHAVDRRFNGNLIALQVKVALRGTFGGPRFDLWNTNISEDDSLDLAYDAMWWLLREYIYSQFLQQLSKEARERVVKQAQEPTVSK